MFESSPIAGRLRLWSEQNPYFAVVILVSLVARLYWEFWRPDYLMWWSIDGYPTLVAANLLLEGNAASIYHPGLWLKGLGNPEWHRMLGNLRIIPGGTSFLYHPLYLYVASPVLGLFSYEFFVPAWLMVNAVSIGVIAAESLCFCVVPTARLRWILALVIALSFPGMYGAYLGQNVAPAFAVFLVSSRLLHSGKVGIGIPGLILAAAMKMWLLPLVVLSALLGGIRSFLWGMAGLTAGLWILPWWLNADLMERYLEVVRKFSEVTIFAFNNVSIWAAFARLADDSWILSSHRWQPRQAPSEIQSLVILAAAWVFVVVVLLAIRKRPSRADLMVSASTLVLLLPGVVWTHYFLLVLPLAIRLITDDCRWGRWLGGLGGCLLVVPWHNMPNVFPAWPTSVSIGNSPVLAQCLLAAPIILATLGALSLLMLDRPATRDPTPEFRTVR